MQQLLKPQELATLINVSVPTIMNWYYGGIIPRSAPCRTCYSLRARAGDAIESVQRLKTLRGGEFVELAEEVAEFEWTVDESQRHEKGIDCNSLESARFRGMIGKKPPNRPPPTTRARARRRIVNIGVLVEEKK